MKLKKKYDIGGFIDSIDSSLDKLGIWGKLGVQVLDPTGVTSWKDLETSLKDFQKVGGLKEAGSLALAGLGAIPAFGVFAKLGKIATLGGNKFPKLTKLLSETNDTINAGKLLKKTSDLPKGIDVNIYKKLIDPDTNVTKIIESLDTSDLAKLRSCVESSAQQYIKSLGNATKTQKQTKKLEKYEKLLSDIDTESEKKFKEAVEAGMDISEDLPSVTKYHEFDVDNNGAIVAHRSYYNLNRKVDKEKLNRANKNRKDFEEENSEIYFT